MIPKTLWGGSEKTSNEGGAVNSGGGGRGQGGGDGWGQGGSGRGQSYAVRSVAGVPLLALLSGRKAVMVSGCSSRSRWSSVGGPLEGVVAVVGEGCALTLLRERGAHRAGLSPR